MYKLTEPAVFFNQTVSSSVTRTSDGAVIPFDPDNTDYQAYLKWLEEGNTPEAAD
jgi:hypothetical protein